MSSVALVYVLAVMLVVSSLAFVQRLVRRQSIGEEDAHGY